MTRATQSAIVGNMDQHRTVEATATDPIRFGSFVSLNGDRCSPDPERTGIGGIAKRPHQAGASEGYAAGEIVTVLTDGGVQADLAEGQRWAEVRKGRVVSPGNDDGLRSR